MPRDAWLGIELRHFAALDAISNERSFGRAANRLGYVQSAISRQISCLEQITGRRLIDRSRGPRPVRLTDAGEMLRARAEDIVRRIAAAKSELDRLNEERMDEVRVIGRAER